MTDVHNPDIHQPVIMSQSQERSDTFVSSGSAVTSLLSEEKKSIEQEINENQIKRVYHEGNLEITNILLIDEEGRPVQISIYPNRKMIIDKEEHKY